MASDIERCDFCGDWTVVGKPCPVEKELSKRVEIVVGGPEKKRCQAFGEGARNPFPFEVPPTHLN